MIPYITAVIHKYMYSNSSIVHEYKKYVVYMDPPSHIDAPHICVYNEFGGISHYNWRTLNIREYSSIYRTPTANDYRYTVADISPNYNHQRTDAAYDLWEKLK